MPGGAAVVALVGVAVGLQAAAKAGRAGGAYVEPVAVRIQIIFYVVLVKRYVVAFGELVGLFPRGHFHLEELYIAFVVSMI